MVTWRFSEKLSLKFQKYTITAPTLIADQDTR